MDGLQGSVAARPTVDAAAFALRTELAIASDIGLPTAPLGREPAPKP